MSKITVSGEVRYALPNSMGLGRRGVDRRRHDARHRDRGVNAGCAGSPSRVRLRAVSDLARREQRRVRLGVGVDLGHPPRCRVGEIAVGKRADLVLIYGDPTHDIATVRNPDAVICRGVVYDPADLFGGVEMRRVAARPQHCAIARCVRRCCHVAARRSARRGHRRRGCGVHTVPPGGDGAAAARAELLGSRCRSAGRRRGAAGRARRQRVGHFTFNDRGAVETCTPARARRGRRAAPVPRHRPRSLRRRSTSGSTTPAAC